jgi:acetoin utilization protein AcuC
MDQENMPRVTVYRGEALASYGFGENHPFGADRYYAFDARYRELGLHTLVQESAPVCASQEEIERFHTHEYVERVKARSSSGSGYLDAGDTPAFKGIYEAAATVVGTVVTAIDVLMQGDGQRAFVPIAGLHHARRDQAAGFCAFNDCGVAIETLLHQYGLARVAYVDIDAHHGDGVFYAFENDPRLLFADIHEDGRYLYPGTGAIEETGTGDASGMKLNLPAPPGSRDDVFDIFWERIENYLHQHQPEFILLQAGADSIVGDPITHMQFTAAAHAKAARQLCGIADQYAGGRLLVMGGGGYNRENLASAWTAVIQAMAAASN